MYDDLVDEDSQEQTLTLLSDTQWLVLSVFYLVTYHFIVFMYYLGL